MDISNRNADWPILVARKIGPHSFQRWDNTDLGSLGSRYLGKVLIDCKFRFGDSEWGTLGTSKVPAGVIYVDLTFHQPKGHRLASASVQISLQEYETTTDRSAKDRGKDKVNSLASGLAVTDKFGPQMLTGKPTTSFGRTSYSLIPQAGAMGFNFGGVGVSGDRMVAYSSQWVLDGHLVPCNADDVVSGGATYKTLKWALSENDFVSQSQAHSSVVHTGFAITHEAKPFYIKVKIDGKLRKVSDRLKSVLVFPPRSRKDQGTALTLLRLSSQHRKGLPLDSLARGLKDVMLQKNLHAVPKELPNTLPASENDPGTMGDPPAAPPSYTSEEPQTPVDNDIEMLSAALTTFAAVTEEERFDETATTSPIPAAELSRTNPMDVSNTEVISRRVDEKGFEMVQDRVRRLSAYPFVVTLIHALTRLLDLIEGAKGRKKDG